MQALWAALVAIGTYLISRFGAVAAAAAVFATLTIAFGVAIDEALDFVVPDLPSWAALGFAMLPSQVPGYVGAYLAALAARRVYDVSTTALGFRV